MQHADEGRPSASMRSLFAALLQAIPSGLLRRRRPARDNLVPFSRWVAAQARRARATAPHADIEKAGRDGGGQVRFADVPARDIVRSNPAKSAPR